MIEFALRNQAGETRVIIADEVIDRMAALARNPERETGGVLIGQYIEHGLAALVELASDPPDDSSAGLNWFERGKNGLAELLQEQWGLVARRYYVGEWHYHPLGHAEPSPQDIHQMLAISEDDSYRCALPLLIIVSPATLRRRTARVFVLRDHRLHEFVIA